MQASRLRSRHFSSLLNFETMIYKSLLFISMMCFVQCFYAQTGASTGEARTYTTRRTTEIVNAAALKVFEDVTANTELKN